MNPRRLFLALIPLLAVQAFADIYSWTDRNGVKHFSNDPPPAGEAVTNVIVMKETPDEVAPSDTARSESEEPPENQAAAADRQIYIYIDPGSDECREALAFFDQNRIPYNKIDITASDEERQRFKNVEGTKVPLIFIGARRMNGWDEEIARVYLGMKKESTINEKAVRALDLGKSR
jgi:glutaredoxin